MSIEELVQRIQKGENLKEKLYEQIQRLLFLICRRYLPYALNRGYDLEDLIAIAWIGVENALRAYREDKGAKFTTYLDYHIKRPVLSFLGYSKDAPLVLSLDEPIPGMDDCTFGDTVSDPESGLAFDNIDNDVVYGEAVKIALEEISEKDAELLKLYYIHGVSLKAIADSRGTTADRIRQEKNMALRRVRANPKLRPIYMEEFYQDFHHVTLSRFNTTWTSTTEQAVMNIEREFGKMR